MSGNENEKIELVVEVDGKELSKVVLQEPRSDGLPTKTVSDLIIEKAKNSFRAQGVRPCADRPKLIIASDGRRTMALLDGVVIGAGVKRLDFSTEDPDGSMNGTVRILDLDVGTASLSTDARSFMRWVNGSEE